MHVSEAVPVGDGADRVFRPIQTRVDLHELESTPSTRTHMISGKTRLIAHLGYPTESFTSPMIYNPWFEHRGIDVVVVPMGVRAEHYPETFAALSRLSNFHGALVTMPHKVTTLGLVDVASSKSQIAGACNAVRRCHDGTLLGEQFDGDGFVRGMLARGQSASGARALVVGTGGVGSAIAASLAAAGVRKLCLYDTAPASAEGLASRLAPHYPELQIALGPADPAGHDIVVNATPLGMNSSDPLPLDPERLRPDCFVGDVVLTSRMTPFLEAAAAHGCRTQAGTDMLFEMIPAYLEFFGFGTATVEELQVVATIRY